MKFYVDSRDINPSSNNYTVYGGRIWIKNWNWIINRLTYGNSVTLKAIFTELKLDANEQPVTSGATHYKRLWSIEISHPTSSTWKCYFHTLDGHDYEGETVQTSDIAYYLSHVMDNMIGYRTCLFLESYSSFISGLASYVDADYNKDLIYPDEIAIFVFQLVSPKKYVRKKLDQRIVTGWDDRRIITGQFRNVVGYKTLEFEYEYNSEQYNSSDSLPKWDYVYIPSLKRFYFASVKSIVGTVNPKKNIFTISLTEDVLTSFAENVYASRGYIERNEFTYNDDMVDDLVKMDYNKSVTIQNVEGANILTDIFRTQAQEDGTTADSYSVVVTVVDNH